MSTQFNFRTFPVNIPVLCIPRVYPNITESRIRRIFNDLDVGELDRIDIISKFNEKGEKFNRVFVHFRAWNNSENANIARERLLAGKEIKIVYDDPWFWKVSAYRESSEHKQSGASKRKATLLFDSDEEPRPHNARPTRPHNARPYNTRPHATRPHTARPHTARPHTARPQDARPQDARPNYRAETFSRDDTAYQPLVGMPRPDSDRDDMGPAIDYGNVPLTLLRKKPIKIEDEPEGEI